MQSSVAGTVPPIDEFDRLCMLHDAEYANNHDLARADVSFARRAAQLDAFALPAAIAVGAQGLVRYAARAADSFNNHSESIMNKNNTKKTPNLRGSKNRTNSSATGQPKQPGLAISRVEPPVSIGTTMRATPPVVMRTVNTARIVGKDFVGTVEGAGVATFGLGKSALLSPAYFQSTILGNLARSFEKYCFTRLRIHYVPKVATSAVGQVVLCSQRSVSEPGLQPEAATFLARAMSQGNAVFSPLWMPCHIDIDCDSAWKLVDPATTSDPDDAIHEELQVYTQVSTSGQVGYLFAEYDVKFSEPIYQPHSTSMPITSGPGQRISLREPAGVNLVGDAFRLVEIGAALGISNLPIGTIVRFVFDIQGSIPATGTTFANALAVNVNYHTTNTAFSNTTVSLPMVGGLTLYLANSSTVVSVYTSLEAAVAGVGSGQVYYATATTLIGTYVGDAAIVRYGQSVLSSVQ